LRRRQDLRRERTFVAEGDKVVRRLLESPFPIVSLLITEQWLKRIEELLARRTDTVDVHVASREQIERITGFECYQGIKAIGRADAPPSLAQALERAAPPRFFVALDGLNNAENLGVIVRNAAALGAQAVIQGETSASPFLTRAIRVSMGAAFRLPVVETESLVAALRALGRAGVRRVAAHPHTEQRRLSQADLRGDVCIVLGNEGCGLVPEVLTECDEQVAIPMHSAIDSLNVGSASAAFFYEVARQLA
jgi:tRNA G18 (ribose-2'-O)-methylase SpoU